MNSKASGRNSHKSTKSTASTDLDSSFDLNDPLPRTNPCKHKT